MMTAKCFIPKTTPPLSPGEYDVIRQIWDGKQNKEIAHNRHTSEQTVKNQVHGLIGKLNARNRLDLALWFERNVIARQNEVSAA